MSDSLVHTLCSLDPAPVYIGPIKRKDGTIVPLFCDTIPLLFWPESWHALTKELMAAIEDVACDVLVGAMTSGVPVAAALAYQMQKRYCWVRKQSKGYSQNRLIEGVLRPGDRVVLVDDFFVWGESKDAFIGSLREAGANVVATLSIGVANEDVARQWARDRQIDLRWLLSQRQVTRCLLERKVIRPGLARVTEAFIDDMRAWQKDPVLWQLLLEERQHHQHLLLASAQQGT